MDKGEITQRDDGKIPKEIERYINDWKLIFIDIREIDTKLIKDKEIRDMIESVKEIYSMKKGEKVEGIEISKEATMTAGAITESKWLIEEAMKVDMCKAMENYTKEIFEDRKM